MPDLYLDMGAARVGVNGIPAYQNVLGTNAAVGGYAFPSGSVTSIYFQFKITNYTSGNLTLVLDGYSTTTSTNTTTFEAQIGALTPGVDTTLWTTKALATATSATWTGRSTANSPQTATITISNLDSLANGDDVLLRIGRQNAGTLANDVIITTAVLSWT